VEDQQVDLIDAELARTLLETMQSLVVSVVADPDLGLDKDLRSLEARVPDSLAHLPLVAVRRGCVHVLVAVSERRLDCGPRLLRRRLEDPKTEGRQVDTVIQGHEFHASTVGPETRTRQALPSPLLTDPIGTRTRPLMPLHLEQRADTVASRSFRSSSGV
jgi:hypothetical protein